MSNTKNWTDALGKPIEIGATYAYTTSSNGINSIGYGKAVNVSKTGRVRLTEVLWQSVYGNDVILPENFKSVKDVSVYSSRLIKIE